ncbi:helicase [Seminavis robusta]|uniref:Helicase n=1 Tax=Seminavis robusta TaxID=568900 RepID=A0A9N8HEY8_9STRA|nr:helicase [Seminavis robusta]|eukprot:Sro407_g136740.1 helicase (489) ;mRNA; f:54034-55836
MSQTNRKRTSSSSISSADLTSPEDMDPPRKMTFWERGYKSLKSFREKHGHTNVPYRYEEDRTLGTWTARQRKLKDELTDDQRRLLEEIGFTWQSTQDRAWMEKFDRLKTYFEKEGHSCVPTSYPDDPELGEWTAKQRQKETQGRLSQERRELLDSVKFVYRINKFVKRKSTAREDKKWWEQLERLIFFLLEHGHTLVPFQYFADKSLGRWVNEQRCQNMRGLLRHDRRDILSAIGFVWKVNSRKGQLILEDGADDNSQWAYNFRQLVEYKEMHGSFPAAGMDAPLSLWADAQRSIMEEGDMEEMRAQRLAAIGFCRDGEDEIWDTNYAKLQAQGYNSIYTLEDSCLSHWVIIQRYLYKKGQLHQDKKMQLFDIPGFVWDSSPLNLPKPESKHVLKEKQRRNSNSSNNNKENKKPSKGKKKVVATPLEEQRQTTSTISAPENKKPIKKRIPYVVASSTPSIATSTPANEIEGFCGLLAIASSFRAKENI